MLTTYSAYAFAISTLVIVLFQIAMALGAPWGKLAMGGRYPGKFPTLIRIAALVQAVVLVLLALTVVIKAGLLLPNLYKVSSVGIWIVVTISCISLFLNLITPSKEERILWSPIALLLAICSLVVALF